MSTAPLLSAPAPARRAQAVIWAGAAIALTAVNLRTAVTGITPLLETIGADLGFGVAVAGLLGTVPAASFAVFGFLAPVVTRRFGLERTATVALALTAVSLLLRATAPTTPLVVLSTVLALAGHYGYAGVDEFERHFLDDPVVAFRGKVEMAYDEEVDRAYPERWIGKVTVFATDGRVLHGRVDEPKGDPGNTLSRDEIATKLKQLVKFSGALDEAHAERLLDDAWRVVSAPRVGPLLGAVTAVAA